MSAILEELWRVRPWTFPALAVVFLVPIARALTLPLASGDRSLMRVSRFFGMWEHLVFLPRDTVVALWLAGFTFWHLYLAAMFASQAEAFAAAGGACLLGASALQRHLRRRGHRALVAFAREHPEIHPQEFFDHFLCASGVLRHRLPERPFATVDPTRLAFSEGKGLGWVPLRDAAAGLWSTVWLARLLVAESRERPQHLAESASAMALIWAARVAQLMRADVTVEGREHLRPAGPPQIFLFNHLSFLDFAYAVLTLAARPQDSEGTSLARCMPSFLLAKDHFRDNFFYYRLIGLGRVADVLGMTFIDRSGEGDAARAQAVARTASTKLLSDGMTLAIYPQGTRAAPYVGSRGERLDGAYYTVGSKRRIKADGAHLKKGAAFIATEAALELAKRGRAEAVELFPVALSGTGIACPRGRMRVQAGVSIRLLAGEPIEVSPSSVRDLSGGEGKAAAEPLLAFVAELHRRIDVALKSLLRVHAILERRFFEEIRGILDPPEQEEVALAMKPWRGDDFLVHAILDAIYACPQAARRALINELARLLINFASREELLAFKGRVADAL